MSISFKDLGLPEAITFALARRSITEPFPIQTEAIPGALDGRDISGKAPTGSGKTLAFGLPVLTRVGQGKPHHPRALVLAPTRELAQQIVTELKPLAAAVGRRITAVYGGVAYAGQKSAMRRGVDILVATPGRLEDLIDQREVDLSSVDLVVVDEADRMADMGFLPAVRRLLDQTADVRQTLLFSATLDGDVAVLSREYQRSPLPIEAGAMDDTTVEASHHFWRTHREDRVGHTADLIKTSGRTIVFTRTRRGADRLARRLNRDGIDALPIHGGRSQNQRNRALKAFATGSASALIATDVAARGIHVDAVNCVVHFDLAGDHKDYLHRSGRTARAGAGGTVVTLVMSDQEKEVRRMQRTLGMSTPITEPDLDRLRAEVSAPARRTDRPRPQHQPTLRRPDQGSRSIFVGNLPWKTTSVELEALFAAHGEVRGATIATRGNTGRSKGYGFVEMATDDSHLAIAALQQARLEGRQLQIRFAR